MATDGNGSGERGRGLPAVTAVVPVKDLECAKSRLSRLLTGGQRRELTLAMLRDVLAALLAVPAVGRVLVVSRDPAVLATAGAAGAEPRAEQAGSLNGALAEVAAAMDPRVALLVIPADLPTLRPPDVRHLLALAAAPEPGELPGRNGGAQMVIIPSRDGGTGALLLRPPGGVPFCFGVGSFAAHVAAARACGVPVRVTRNRRFAFDVDGEADLHRLRSAGETGEETRRFLAALAPPLQLAARNEKPRPN